MEKIRSLDKPVFFNSAERKSYLESFESEIKYFDDNFSRKGGFFDMTIDSSVVSSEFSEIKTSVNDLNDLICEILKLFPSTDKR